MITTVGQVLINEALPKDLRDYTRILDKNGIRELGRKIYDRYGEQYRDIIQSLMEVGRDSAHSIGSSVSLTGLRKSPYAKAKINELNTKINKIVHNPIFNQEEKDKQIVQLLLKAIPDIREGQYKEGLAEGNPFALQVLSGSRGNASQLGSLRAGDLLVADHRDRPVPIPITHSYSEGLDPVEYWASGYGSRKGEIAKKLSVAKAGFLSKQLNNATHKLVATNEKPIPGTGLPVDADDNDNVGAVLAADYGEFKAGTVITPAIHNKLREQQKRILVYSPIVSVTNVLGGVPRLAAGVREHGRLPSPGENVGLPAAQALGEKLSQSQLSMKHSAGVIGAGPKAGDFGGFNAINQIVQVPKMFAGGATLSKIDGMVQSIEEAPQGGWYVLVDRERHYVPADREVIVKKGELLEAGDMLSSGVPNPAEIVHYKGIGEGRRYMTKALMDVYKNTGIKAHRRNIEMLARGLVNHVRITDPDGLNGALFDDVVEYDKLAAKYRPRRGYQTLPPKLAKGKYLEKPVLHYTIGTRITPRVINELNEFKVPTVVVHDNEPPFIPEQHRAMDVLFYSDDWMQQMGGFSISKAFQKSVHRGATSSTHTYSYIPGLAEGVNFGKKPDTPY